MVAADVVRESVVEREVHVVASAAIVAVVEDGPDSLDEPGRVSRTPVTRRLLQKRAVLVLPEYMQK